MSDFRLILALCAVQAAAAQDSLDRVEEFLTFNSPGNEIRTRVSGLADLEAYEFSQPAPALIASEHYTLLNPRVTLFLDSQLGDKFYFFGQARFDRGFDPGDRPLQGRLEEYALRFTPWEDGRFNLQAGKFATIVGNWVPRHLSWENPFINAPLPYETITPVSDADLPLRAAQLLEPITEKYDYNPLIWGPNYTTGFSIAGRLNQVDAAVEVKNAPLTSRPESWSATAIGFDHPTVSGRAGWRPNVMWNLGLSASDGAYLRPEAQAALPAGRSIGDYHQSLLGQDVSFAWRHLQIWAEFYEARWDIPRVGAADTFSYYIEAKYKVSPRFFTALRWNQQFYSTVRDETGKEFAWGRDLWRTDAALGFRPTAHTQLKMEYSLQREASPGSDFGHILAAQFTLRF